MKQTQSKEKTTISIKENRGEEMPKQADQNTRSAENLSKRIFYTAIFCFLCICDQRRGSAPGYVQMMFVNLSWAAVLLLQFTAVEIRDLLKVPYAIFTGLSIVATLVCLRFRSGDLFFGRFFVGQWYAGCLVAWLIGLFLLYTISEAVRGKKKREAGTPFFLQAIFYVAMIVAYVLNKDLWPALMVLVFGNLYYRNRSEEDKECLLNNLSNGIILAFFLIQGQAFIFRPFDTLRYNGMYANPNMNGLFYMLVYCACLSKYCYYYTKQDGGKEDKNGKTTEDAIGKKTGKKICGDILLRWFFLILGASLWAFAIFTQCRSALMGMAATTAVAGIHCLMMRRAKVLKNGICMVAGLLVCIAITLPISYLAVRYLPPFFHHPIWFEGEYSEEKVHSWDPYDSPKFTNYQQIIESFTGRLHDANGQSVVAEIQAPAGDVETVQTDTEDVNVTQTPAGDVETGQTDAVQTQELQGTTEIDTATEVITDDTTGPAPEITTDATENKSTPVFDYEEENSLKIRKAIYSHYLSNLRLTGHKDEENGLQITPNYFAPHAHDLFLQIAFSFGIITGALFLIWVILTLVMLAKQAFKDRKRIDPFLFELSIVLFGLMEIMWRTGQLSFTLLFILPMFVATKKRRE